MKTTTTKTPALYVFNAGGRGLPLDEPSSRNVWGYGVSRGFVSSESGYVRSEETWQAVVARLREYNANARRAFHCICKVGLADAGIDLVGVRELGALDKTFREVVDLLKARTP